jgi:hypothetical protein
MSLRPQPPLPPVPDDTARVARAAFRRGNPYLVLRDRLGAVFDDAGFADLYPKLGQPIQWRIEGRKGYAETHPAMVKEAKRLARKSPKTGRGRSLNEIGAELAALGYTTAKGKQFSAEQVRRLVGRV